LSALGSLKGKTALVTGGAGHLGRVIGETLAELGADVTLMDRAGSGVEKICDELRNRFGGTATALMCDLEVEAQRQDAIRKLAADRRGLSVLVNNAAFVGTSELKGWSEPFDRQSLETWRRALEVNLSAAFELCQGLHGSLTKARGSIINIASIYGVYGPDWRLYEGTSMASPAAYAASKGGLIQLSRWLATTLAPDVRVNVISPGGILRGQSESFVNAYTARTPLKRMMSEDDIRGAVAFLATDLSAYVTGQNIVVDGGWGVW
jgi:NAD(P)-dependent dehydrogenase (short-subunit alcohol dehydrogenase family)